MTKQTWLTFALLAASLVCGYSLGRLHSTRKQNAIPTMKTPIAPSIESYPKNRDTDSAFADGMVTGVRLEKRRQEGESEDRE